MNLYEKITDERAAKLRKNAEILLKIRFYDVSLLPFLQRQHNV